MLRGMIRIRTRIVPLWVVLSICGLTLDTQAAQKQTRVTVFFLPADGFTPKVISKVSTTFINALKKNKRLQVKDSDKLLVEFSGEVPRDKISAAEDLLNQGIDLLKGDNPGEAITALEQSVAGFEEVLAFIKKGLLARATLTLGVALAEDKQSRAAVTVFSNLLIWRPFVKFDTTTFSSRHLPLFEAARKKTKRRKRGSIELNTEPPGAKAYIDGRFVGVTPTEAFGFSSGDHYATYKLSGYIKAAQRVKVSAKRQLSYTQALGQSEKFLLLEQTLEGAKKDLGKAKADAEMVSLSSFLFIDQVIFATIGYAGPESITIQAYLYDLRSKLRLNHSTMTLETDALKPLNQLASNLYLNVRYDGTIAAPPEPPPPPPIVRTPFYATWWFWSAIAVGATAGVLIPYLVWPESNEWPPDNARIEFKN